MGAFRIDFSGHQSLLLYTVTLPNVDILTEFLTAILVYDIYSEHGPYSMKVWNTGGEEENLVHDYKLLDIPEGTAEVFKKYNELYPLTTATVVNPGSHDQVH